MKRIPNVPFYPNHADNMRCMLAVYQSILDHFLKRKMSWDEIAAFAGYQPGRAAWSVKSLVQFARMGFDVRMVESFDYARYADEGMGYLQERFTRPEELDWQLQHTNLAEIQPQIPQFLKTIEYEQRSPNLQDIDAMLDDGRLVFVTLNGHVLDGTEGYSNHAVLIYSKEGDEYIVHDPGLPPMPERRVLRDTIYKAMGGDHNTSETTGFKLKARRNLRLDQYVVSQFKELSRAYATTLIEQGKVLVNGQAGKPGYKLREHDEVTIDYDEAHLKNIPDIDLPVLYEDDDCLVINKPVGVLTHSRGNYDAEATVASFLRRYISKPERFQQGQRAGIVHRLDRLTSGLMICAKTPEALAWLQKQFHDRQAHKTYAAVISGALKPEAAVIDMPIERNPKAPATFRVGPNGKAAITAYETVSQNTKYSLLELRPQTGRTHQLRVHLAQQGHPIVGDFLYGGEKADRLYLHAHKLSVTLPNGSEKSFEAPVPAAFTEKVQ